MRFICLQSKDVIDASTGSKIGYVSDLEIDPCYHSVLAIIVEKFSMFKLMSFFKGPPTLVIPIENIVTIGEDVIIVNC